MQCSLIFALLATAQGRTERGLGGGHSDRMSWRRHVHVLQSIYCVVMSAAGLKQQMSLLPCKRHVLPETLRCFLRPPLPLQCACSKAVACDMQASGQGRGKSS